MPAQALVDIGSREDAGKIRLFKGRAAGTATHRFTAGAWPVRVMEITDEIRELILSGASAMELKRKAIEEGMISLRLRAPEAPEGQSTVEEVVRETVL